MEKNIFIKKYKNNVMDEALISSIYEYACCDDDRNLKDVEFLLPVLNELYYYKTKFISNIEDFYSHDYYGTYNLLKDNEKFIYNMIDKGFSTNEISEFLIFECKKTMNALLKDYTSDGEVPYELEDEYYDLLEDGLTEEEAKKQLFRGTYRLQILFNKLCGFIGV